MHTQEQKRSKKNHHVFDNFTLSSSDSGVINKLQGRLEELELFPKTWQNLILEDYLWIGHCEYDIRCFAMQCKLNILILSPAQYELTSEDGSSKFIDPRVIAIPDDMLVLKLNGKHYQPLELIACPKAKIENDSTYMNKIWRPKPRNPFSLMASDDDENSEEDSDDDEEEIKADKMEKDEKMEEEDEYEDEYEDEFEVDEFEEEEEFEEEFEDEFVGEVVGSKISSGKLKRRRGYKNGRHLSSLLHENVLEVKKKTVIMKKSSFSEFHFLIIE